MSQYTVVAGDTLFLIAQQFHIKLAALIAANPQLNGSTLIQIGQVLNLPGVPVAPPGGQLYIVVGGDTLFLISQRFGITLAELIAANPQLNGSTLILVGDVLTIPTSNTPSTNGTGPGGRHAFSGPASNFPDPSQWKALADLWSINVPEMQVNDSPSEIAAIKSSIDIVAASSGVDGRVILCTIMQESSGNVRVRTTNNGVRNPGLMQSHDGVEFDPANPDGSILQMIRDGTEGTASGDGLKQTIASHGNVYVGLRLYNSGSVDLNNLSNGLGSTDGYVSDIANRLLGQ